MEATWSDPQYAHQCNEKNADNDPPHTSVVKLGNECVSPQKISWLLTSTSKIIFPLIICFLVKNKNRKK